MSAPVESVVAIPDELLPRLHELAVLVGSGSV